MVLLEFLLGLALGLGLWTWSYWRLKAQLRSLLKGSPGAAELMETLSIASVIRREMRYLNQQIQQRESDLTVWEKIGDFAPFGILLLDKDNHLLWCNQQAQQWLKIDRWQPEKLRLLLELVRSSELDRLIEQTRQAQAPQVQEWMFYPSVAAPRTELDRSESNIPDASNWTTLDLKACGCPLPQGQVVVFIENQQSLKELSVNRDRFFSDLTHELRTPLTSLSLLAETLAKRLSPPEQRWAELMGSEIDRLMQLVQDWLDLAMVKENPQQSFKLFPLNLADPILEAWQSLRPLAEKKAIALDLPDLSNLRLEGDASRLTQVFLNLFDNSIKHSPPQSEIKLQVEANPSQLTLHLIDQGSGFAVQDLPHIFDRLYRGDASRSRQTSENGRSHSGSGLGLAIAQVIIQAHGGKITAQNHPQTRGAWLTITLPVAQSAT